MKKWEKKVSLFTILSMFLIVLAGFTYAVWSRTFTQSGISSNSYDCFNISYSASADKIDQLNFYPQTDEDGLKNDSYEITVENKCSTAATYIVKLNIMNTSTLDESYVKAAIGDNVMLLSDKDDTTSNVTGASKAKVLKVGVINGKSSEIISIRSWLDENTPNASARDKSFVFKMTVEAEVGVSNYLASRIIKNGIITDKVNYTTISTNSGLYVAEDNLGDSFYYRGNVTNNYLEFAGTLWRIVRINGDGTIRLISDNEIGMSNISDIYNNYAVGYTYNNSNTCTAANPCTSTSGIASNINNFLEDWYKNNIFINNFDSYVAISDFCNDTSIASGSEADGYIYNASHRLSSGNPSLKCPDTTQTYGGFYKLKIGLISVDEANMAGAGYWEHEYSNDSTYLLHDNTWSWTFTPQATYGIGSDGAYFSIETNYTPINNDSYDNEYGIRPVINLKADTKVTSGIGTKDKPYKIS